MFVELLNNYSDIRNLLNQEKECINKQKDNDILKSFIEKNTLNRNLKFIYSLISQEYDNFLRDFDKSKEDFEKSIILTQELNKNDMEKKYNGKWNNEYIKSLKKELENYTPEKKYSQKLEYIDYLIENLDFAYNFVNNFNNHEISLFHLNRLFIPKVVLFYAVQKNDKFITIDTTPNLKESLEDSTIKNIMTNNIMLVYDYDVVYLNELVCLYIQLLLEKKITIRQCKNCRKYFVTESRTDEIYCNRISPQNPNKTCKEYGAKKTYRDNIKSRPLKDEHYKTSQFFRMRIKRNKDKNNIEEVKKLEKQFAKYKLDYEKKQKQYNNKKLMEEDFKNWIIHQKEQ